MQREITSEFLFMKRNIYIYIYIEKFQISKMKFFDKKIQIWFFK